MSERAEFTRRICEQPDDDLARLVFADWLDEHDEPRRAEFIRDTLGAWPVVSDFAPELLALVPGMTRSGFGKEDDAAGGRPYWRFGLPGGHAAKFVFSRGFVAHVEMPCAAFVACAAELLAGCPVTSVRLTDRSPYPAHGGRWVWWNAEYSTFWSAGIPYEVFDCFSDDDGGGFDWHGDGYRVSRWWATSELSVRAVSVACVAFGRHAAKLPLLPEPVPEAA